MTLCAIKGQIKNLRIYPNLSSERAQLLFLILDAKMVKDISRMRKICVIHFQPLLLIYDI